PDQRASSSAVAHLVLVRRYPHIMKGMRFLRRHWYNLGLVFGAIAIGVALLGNLQTVQVILLLLFAALTLHQFEELGWPGGFPWYYNEIIRPKGGPLDRNPLTQNNNLFIN